MCKIKCKMFCKILDEVKSVAEMLLYINQDQLAQQLYLLMNEFLEDIRKNKREIWPPPSEIKSPDSEEPSISTNPPSQINIPQNLIGKSFDNRNL